MIFVSVGTHEQGFDRLIKEVDKFAKENNIKDIFIQKGFTKYNPTHCAYKELISPDEMNHYMNTANLVITHGGPSTYMEALSKNKPVIVVPRLSKYDEHVNDHQLDFARKITNNSNYEFPIITEIKDLATQIKKSLDSKSKTHIKSNTHNFNTQFKQILESLL